MEILKGFWELAVLFLGLTFFLGTLHGCYRAGVLDPVAQEVARRTRRAQEKGKRFANRVNAAFAGAVRGGKQTWEDFVETQPDDPFQS